ncbi:MAG: hypothetical protein Q8S18_05550 [Bacteroidales bacterium]|nr:hypothetical protein [Bacteroidales bacterium]
MKTRILTTYAILSILLMVTIFTGLSCKKLKDVTDGAKLIVDFNIIETSIDVKLYDAKTGQLIGFDDDKSVTITITGSDKNGVLDATGLQPANNQYLSQKGILGLALNPNSEYTPSSMRTVSFNIVARLEGYLTTSQHVSLSATGKNFVRINMVALDNPPDGVTVLNESGLGNVFNGQLEESVVVTTPGNMAELTIPAGITMKDADGIALSGPLDILLVHFDNTVDEAMSAFPGGLMTNVNLMDGSTADGMFFSAGFVAIEIRDGSGRQAKTFENGTLGLISVVGDNTFNPEAQRNVAAGDVIPLWSYDEETGMWTEEDELIIESNEGSFQISAQLSHLSYFNFDWFWTEYCTYGPEFNFIVNGDVCDCFPLEGVMRRQSDNAVISWLYFWICQDEPVQTFFAPANIPVYIEWFDENNPTITVNAEYQPTMIDNLCQGTPITIYLTAVPYGTIVTAEVEAYCASDPNFIIRPNFSVYFHKAGDLNLRYAEMVNGYAEICGVEVGATYYIFCYYDGTYYYEPFTVTQTSYEYINFELPAEVCSEVFGY